MTRSLHSIGVLTFNVRKGLLLSSIVGSLLAGMPISASAHVDPGQPSVPGHHIGTSMCNGGITYGYDTTVPRQVVANFPTWIYGATSDPNEWAAWTPVLYKYDFVNSRWNLVATKPYMWVHTPYVYGYPGSPSQTFGTANAPLDAGWYLVANWIYWYSTNQYHYEGQVLNCT